ncbi:hypothetical protein BDA99DRAFT_338284 [Phascolomyces articulosus]|uniref:Uncharacterized protein n=1 Tax=Phascolomyces articulosus TaxID=60185 RepID=A0AAD5K4D1_9FUNG|nr:hypothetical protein BDA99DRAFT_338284 [Phascolomyces articulosus]
MLAKERMSQVLPTVKCSDCGEDVQIRKLGEHVCSNMPPVPTLPILPRQQPHQQYDKYNYKSPSPTSPLQSPKRYDSYSTTSSNDKYNNSNQRGPMTPPYHGLVSELRRPSVKDQQHQQQTSLPSPSSSGSGSRSPPLYRDDLSRSRHNDHDYYSRPSTGSSQSPKSNGFPASSYDYRPLNSTSPAPGDLTKK